jgi:hypothetical protein
MRRTAFASKAGIVGVWHQLNLLKRNARVNGVAQYMTTCSAYTLAEALILAVSARIS